MAETGIGPVTVKRRLYRPREAAALLAVCTKTLRHMMDNREIPFVIVGKRRKLAADDIDRFIKEGGSPCPSTGAGKRASSTSPLGKW